MTCDGRFARRNHEHQQGPRSIRTSAAEIPDWKALGLDPDRVYKLLRDPDELAKGRADVQQHPVGCRGMSRSLRMIISRILVIGSTGTDADFDGSHLRNSPGLCGRADAIDDIESDVKKELSASVSLPRGL